jgi:ABC-2 type transport system permease protein
VKESRSEQEILSRRPGKAQGEAFAHSLLRPFTQGSGFYTLFYKELLRFWKVGFQTIFAPVLTAFLYLLIFSHVLEAHVQVFEGVKYTAFLIPGLAMMALLQNSFANSSSSLIQSKVTGNIVFALLAPLSPFQFFCAYVLAAVVRGLTVGVAVLLVGVAFADLPFAHPLFALVFALFASGMLGTLGLIAAIFADKFDELAAFQNFVVIPLTFLSGVFYSISSLPSFWQSASHFNPFFYMIDGFRYGFVGVSDVPVGLSIVVVACSFLVLSLAALKLLESGYKLRS